MKVFKRTCSVCLLCTFASLFAQQAGQPDTSQTELTESQQRENEQFQTFLTEGEGNAAAEGDVDSGEDEMPTVGIGAFIRMLLVLALVVVAIYFVFRFIKKSSSAGDGQSPDDDVFLRKVSRVGLGAGQSVQIVSLWDRAFVLGVSDSSVSLIKEIDDKEMVDAMNRFADMNSTVKKPRTFEEILNIFSSGKKGFDQSTASTTKRSAYDDKTMSLIASLKAKRLSLLDETTEGAQ